jgi:hypothetical protein
MSTPRRCVGPGAGDGPLWSGRLVVDGRPRVLLPGCLGFCDHFAEFERFTEFLHDAVVVVADHDVAGGDR